MLFGLYFLSSNLDRITSLVLFWICLCLWLLQNNNFSDFGCRFYPMFWYSTKKNNKTNGIINFMVADIKLLLQWWLVVKYIAFIFKPLDNGCRNILHWNCYSCSICACQTIVGVVWKEYEETWDEGKGQEGILSVNHQGEGTYLGKSLQTFYTGCWTHRLQRFRQVTHYTLPTHILLK